MDNRVQILPPKKFSDAPPRGLVLPFFSESEKRGMTEYSVFKRINQLDQFYVDKANCINFRFYGRITEAANLKFQFTATPQVKPDFSFFELNNTNWKAMILAPLKRDTVGDTSITVKDSAFTRTLDFTKGLPALPIPSETIGNKVRNGLLLYLGHNLQTNDVVHITTTQNDSRYTSGVYRIVASVGNKVYIQVLSYDGGTSVVAVNEEASTDSPTPMAIVGGIELGITEAQLMAATGRTDTNWLAVYNPHVYVTKMVDKMSCSYYLRRLYYVANLGDIYPCSFAQNIYAQPQYVYANEKKLSLLPALNNLDTPLTDVYVTFVKQSYAPLHMSLVQANFQNFITTTNWGGIQAFYLDDAMNFDIGNYFYQALVEYNPLLVQETDVNTVEHTFWANVDDAVETNRIRFSYNPFTKVSLRKYSNTISETDLAANLPYYLDTPETRGRYFSEKFQTYRWREILEVGYFEAQGNGLDFPYMNDAFYVYTNVLLNLKNYNSKKENSILSGGYLLSMFNDQEALNRPTNTTGIPILDDSLLSNNKYDAPFAQYTGSVC